MAEPVLFAVEEKVAVITLNRPERRNAINQALLVQLYDAIERKGYQRFVKALFEP